MPANEQMLLEDEELPSLPERPELTLDPADWSEIRALGHRMIDDLVDYHAGLNEQPAWRPPGAADRARWQAPFPAAGVGSAAAYDAFLREIRPFNFGNIHPRAWGWVNGTGSTLGAFAEMLAAGMNPNAWGGEQAATYVEGTIIEHFRATFGMPAGTSGILVSGGSVANLIGLAAAREHAAAPSASGVRTADAQLVVYASVQAHNSIDKAAGLLGIGWDHLRRIPVDANYRMRVDALEAAIAADRAAGLHPACVVATAGTVNTGAIDPLPAIADLCARERIWLHVDGAFGAMAALSEPLRTQVNGLERADSLAFDLHKWLYVPIEAGCVLVRDAAIHRAPFAPPAAYLTMFDRGVSSGPFNYSQLGPQLTRSFRALKVWFSLQAYGTSTHAQLIEQNVRQARYLARLLDAHPQLERMAPVPLNVVCLRYVGSKRLNDSALDALNRELLMRLQESGAAVPSSTVLEGRFVLRLAFTNHRTRKRDIDAFVRTVAEIGSTLEDSAARG